MFAIFRDVASVCRILSARVLRTGADIRQASFFDVPLGIDNRSIKFAAAPFEKIGPSFLTYLDSNELNNKEWSDESLGYERDALVFKGFHWYRSGVSAVDLLSARAKLTFACLERDGTYEIGEFGSSLALVGLAYRKELSSLNGSTASHIYTKISALHDRLIDKVEYRSYYPNNHLLSNLRGIVLTAVFLEFWDAAEAAAKKYFFWLQQLTDHESWLVEGSSSYHASVSLWTAQVISVLDPAKSEKYRRVYFRLMDHVDQFRLANNELLTIGDVCPDRPTLTLLSELDFWDATYQRVPSEKSVAHSSEYGALTTESLKIAISVCPKNRGTRPHHGHVDGGHIIAAKSAQPFITDLGRRSYMAQDALQRYQRSALAHNQMICLFDLYDRFVTRGYLKLASLAPSGRLSCVENKELAFDKRWMFGLLAVYKRRIFVDKRVIISDVYRGIDFFFAKSITFYFAKGISVTKNEHTLLLMSGSSVFMKLKLSGDIKSILKESGLQSSDYGVSSNVVGVTINMKRKYKVTFEMELV